VATSDDTNRHPSNRTTHLLRSSWDVRVRAHRYASGIDRTAGVPLWSEVLAERGVRASQTVLEIGAGPALLAQSAASLGSTVVTLDSAAAMLRTAPSALRKRSVVADIASLPFVTDTFDVVMGRAVLWCLDRPAAALAEIQRVLRRRGVFIAAEPTYGSEGAQRDLADSVHRLWERLTTSVGSEQAAEFQLATQFLKAQSWSVSRWQDELRLLGFTVEVQAVNGMAAAGGPDDYDIITCRKPLE
jgi:SAM-dependent methyltransferase